MKLEFDQFQLDSEQMQVIGPDGPVSMRPLTFSVLSYLIEQAPKVVSRDELLDAVWGHQATSVSSVAQTIKELRKALGDSSSDPHLIATRPRLGYQFIAEVRPLPDDPAQVIGERVVSGLPPARSTSPDRRRWPWTAALLALVVLVIAFVVFAPNEPSESRSDRLPTLAVAQMVNASDDPDMNWLGPALETYLGHALVELGGFRVLSVDARADQESSILTGVDYVIEGQYLMAGVEGPRWLASLRRPGSREIVTSLESRPDEWDIASVSIDMATAIRDRLGFSAPPEADSAAIRARLPRRAGSQQAYFAALQALGDRRPEVALSALERARRQEPDNPRLDLLAAQVHAARGDLASAREFSLQAMSATEFWPRRDRLDIEAMAAMLAFDWQRAAERLQALNQFFPESESSRQLVRALGQAGRFQDAATALDSLRLKQPDDARLALLEAELSSLQKLAEPQLEQARQARQMAEAEGATSLMAAAELSESEALIELGEWHEARTRLEALVDDERLVAGEQARARLELARLEFLQGDLAPALASVERAEARFAEVPHPTGLAEAAMLRGAILERSGRIEESILALEQALERFDAVADPRRTAHANVQFGTTLMRANRADEAIARLEAAARSFRALNDRQGEGAALINHATLIARAGRLPDAEPIFQRALEAFQDAGDRRGEAMALGNLAAIAGDRRDMTTSITLAEQSLAIFEQLGAQTDIARVSYNLALIHRRQGALEAAIERIRQAGDAFASQGAVLMQTRALTTEGAMLVSMGEFDELDRLLARIEELDIEDPAELAVMHIVRGERALVLGDPDTAHGEFTRAHALMESIGAANHMLVTRMHVARAELAMGETINAEQTGRDLAFAFREIRMINREIDALMLLAEALIEQARGDEAAGILAQADERLADSPDAEQTLRMGLLRSRISPPELARERLSWVESAAAEQGFVTLMERARRRLETLAVSRSPAPISEQSNSASDTAAELPAS
ncbi:tetratricopeptide repeat protein [Wenzhouxiangella marina]|uniref:tetratricopeptide repeat protein n=1 Tax=Wenzhouxiangella marina TaxID=1579979 RepID=UPI00067353C4|nr:tetratricopeptide repeat protein [Wenzhouxiangella marina]MBB6088084.1 DNA-binding winged helix-turn-helix (wHTH) protein/tetratricopeptide (TPR) repeat protein [Wenzhouxiangella marina]